MQEPENESGFVVRDKRHSSFEDKKETTEPGEFPEGVSTAPDDPKPEQGQEAEMASSASTGPVNFMSFSTWHFEGGRAHSWQAAITSSHLSSWPRTLTAPSPSSAHTRPPKALLSFIFIKVKFIVMPP